MRNSTDITIARQAIRTAAEAAGARIVTTPHGHTTVEWTPEARKAQDDWRRAKLAELRARKAAGETIN